MKNMDYSRDLFMLRGRLAKEGYDWWWHSFTAKNLENGQTKSFYIEFYTCNPRLAKSEPIIVWNDEKLRLKGIKPSYVMVNVGFWGKEKGQLHNFYPWSDVVINNDKSYSIKAGNCFCSENYTKGEVYVSKEETSIHPEWMSDYGSMKWDLKINKLIPYNVGYGANKFFRRINAFEMYWHAQGMKTEYEGIIELNDVKYVVEPKSSYGYADKNWGKDFTSPWIWLSSNNLVSNISNKKLENSVFDFGGGRPKVFSIPLNRKLLGAIYYQGQYYEFNFSKFWTLCKTDFICFIDDKYLNWRVIQTTKNAKIELNIKCLLEDMIFINYESPKGEKKHNKLYNGGDGFGNIKLYQKIKGKYALIDDIDAFNVGCEYGEFDN